MKSAILEVVARLQLIDTLYRYGHKIIVPPDR